MKLTLISSVFFLAMAALLRADAITINFDKDKAGDLPQGFSTGLTGKGKPGNWVVTAEESAPSKPNVLAQTDMDTTSYRFPVCVYDSLTAKDAEISVKIKPMKGSEDQAGGIVWRYKDANNYYLIRANALENNVVLYKVENGKRTDLPLKEIGRTYGKKIKVSSGQWSTLGVVVNGNLFQAIFNGERLYEVEDNTFPEAGKVGLWTKADSMTYFDDLQITTK